MAAAISVLQTLAPPSSAATLTPGANDANPHDIGSFADIFQAVLVHGSPSEVLPEVRLGIASQSPADELFAETTGNFLPVVPGQFLPQTGVLSTPAIMPPGANANQPLDKAATGYFLKSPLPLQSESKSVVLKSSVGGNAQVLQSATLLSLTDAVYEGSDFPAWLSSARETPGEILALTMLGASKGEPPAFTSLGASLESVSSMAPLLGGPKESGEWGRVNHSPVAMTLDTPLRAPSWGQDFSQRIAWIANNEVQAAQIKLNPPELGPIEIKISMAQEQTNISFTAPHALTREALEAALPRLREVLNESGFNVLNVNISQHSFAEQQQREQTPQGTPSENNDLPFVVEGEEGMATLYRVGMVDAFV